MSTSAEAAAAAAVLALRTRFTFCVHACADDARALKKRVTSPLLMLGVGLVFRCHVNQPWSLGLPVDVMRQRGATRGAHSGQVRKLRNWRGACMRYTVFGLRKGSSHVCEVV